MNYLTLNEVATMNGNESVYVNRIAINSRLIKLSGLNKRDYEAELILYTAINQIKEREKGQGKIAWGARMKVEDIRRAFGNIENMSITSFKAVK